MKPKRNRRYLIGVMVAVVGMILIAGVVLSTLTLMGPQIGSVFSNVVSGLGDGNAAEVPMESPDDEETSDESDEEENVTAEDDPTAAPTQIAVSTAQRTATAIVREATQVAQVTSERADISRTATALAQRNDATPTRDALPDTGGGPSSQPTPTVTIFTIRGTIDLQGNLIYTVRPGDTLTAVSRASGVSIANLRQLNDLSLTAIEPGQTLILRENVNALTSVPTPTLSTTEVAELSTQSALAETEIPVVVDAQGSVGGTRAIGNASVYPYFDNTVTYPESMRVQVDVILNEWFITPTPFGQITQVPANEDVDRPQVDPIGGSQATPRPARDEVDFPDVPPRLIAELVCLPDTFEGCTRKADRPVRLRGVNTWQWVVRPQENLRGQQSLTINLYAANEAGEQTAQAPVWTYGFDVQVGDDGVPAPNVALIGGVLLLGLGVVAAGAFVWQRRGTSAQTRDPDYTPTVFISYRRSTSFGYATQIYEYLTERGADVFFDVESLRQGNFEDKLRQNIEAREHFILILAPQTFESEWVVRESELALQLNKNVVPVLVGDFSFDDETIPPGLTALDLSKHNAIEMNYQYYKAALEKIAEFIGLPSSES